MQNKKSNFKKKIKIVVVSGGFDPVHKGHVRMFNEAKKLGDKLVVILNNDNWIRAKKGCVFMRQGERKEILEALRSVDKVIFSRHKKSSDKLRYNPEYGVSRELEELRPHIFANGGDRKNSDDILESKICEKYGIKMVFNVGRGGKVQSSSWLIESSRKSKKNE